QEQQRRGDEGEPDDGEYQRGPADLVSRDEREQRHGQRVDERGQRGGGAYPVDLRLALPGQPFLGDGDGDEEQPDERAGHARGAEEEIVEVVGCHTHILADRPFRPAARGPAPTSRGEVWRPARSPAATLPPQ